MIINSPDEVWADSQLQKQSYHTALRKDRKGRLHIGVQSQSLFIGEHKAWRKSSCVQHRQELH